MVETKDLEVYAVGIEDLTNEVLEKFLVNGFEYMVLLRNGAYFGLLSADILKQNGECITDKIMCGDGENVFKEARAFFEEKANRKKYLALVDEKGNLLTFLTWNQRNERTPEFIAKQKQKLYLCSKLDYIFHINDWDEYTELYYRFLKENIDEDRIVLGGRNWELCPYCNQKLDTKINKETYMNVNSMGLILNVKELLVNSLDKFRKEYENKRIFYWLDSIFCLYNVADLIFKWGIKPDGYCELKGKREIDIFLGEEVSDVETISCQEDVIIVVDNKDEKNYLSKYVQMDNIILFSDFFYLDALLMEKGSYQTWGTKEQLASFRREIVGIHMHIPFRNFQKNINEPGILLWDNISNKSPQNYKKYMAQVNENVALYSKRKIFETIGQASSMLKIKNFDLAIERRKQCIIYGTASHYTNHWVRVLEMYGLEYMFMDNIENENWNGFCVKSIFDLPFYNVDDILVIINVPYDELPKASAWLKDYHISLENNNAISIYEEIDNQNRGKNVIDICAGPVPQSMVDSNYPCYKVIGKDGQNDYKIMVVGGSTSDSSLYVYHSWPEKLYELFTENGIQVTIYNGAVGGHYSMQELAKVMRDAKKIKPNMIISFSGTNDSGILPLQEGYTNGVIGNNLEDNFNNWIENEKLIWYMANQINAQFFCFAQPQLYLKDNQYRYEKIFTKCIRNSDTCFIDFDWKQKVENVEDEYCWMVNLQDILDDNSQVYFDVCHVTTEGNALIAKSIYHFLKNAM